MLFELEIGAVKSKARDLHLQSVHMCLGLKMRGLLYISIVQHAFVKLGELHVTAIITLRLYWYEQQSEK